MVSRSIIKGKPMKATGFSLISWSFIFFLLVLGASAQQCGRQAGGALCSVGQCCSLWGWCGSTPDYCGAGCQSQCGRPTPTPTPLTPTTSQDGHKIGVCYGRIGNNLPHPEDVVKLYRSRNIGRMRIYDPDQVTLQSLKNSNIELMLGVPNQDLPNIANDANAANSWVQRNVRNYWPSVSFRYIAVGNEVTREPQSMQFVLPAMRNIYNALMFAGLQGQIKVSTAVDNGIVDKSFPPSTGVFRGELQSFMNPIIGFLVSIRSPILFNVYPYFSYIGTANMKLSYALFTYPGTEFWDNNLNYQNLFDAIVDAAYSALEKAGGSSLEIVVSESGWPSAGGIATSMDNARTYNQNLINHVRTGTPKRPGRPVETYLFAMFNENLKNPESERNFGLFYPNTQPVYPWINSI